MKRPLLAVIAAVVMSASPLWAAPDATWIKTHHNFGVIAEDSGRVSCTFRLVNTGDAPLTIVSAKASCGCTTPGFSRDPIAPGDTAALTVAYDPAGRPGRFRKTVTVSTGGEGPSATSRLTISGTVTGSEQSVRAQYPVDGGRMKYQHDMIAMGRIARPHLKTAYLTAYNSSADSLRLRVAGKPSHIDIGFEPALTPPGEPCTLIAYLRTSSTGSWGYVEDTVRITDGRDTIALAVSAVIIEDFSRLSDAERASAPVATLTETALDLGEVDAATVITRTASLKNTGASPLVIRRVYSTDSGVTAAVEAGELQPGESTVITVTADTSAALRGMDGKHDLYRASTGATTGGNGSGGGIIDAKVTVMTNDPASPMQTIRVTGTKN